MTPFNFRAGQFISVVVPTPNSNQKSVKRCYSLSGSPEWGNRFELCVKLVPGGRGSSYLASLKVGSHFDAFAPYGHFVLKSSPRRNIVFISTSSGIAPFRSMLLSQELRDLKPRRVVFITGSRTENLYDGELEASGVEVVRALSQGSTDKAIGNTFRGRVTDYLRSLPANWSWYETDFYICGNPEMVAEVEGILKIGRGVQVENIHRELFSAPKPVGNVVSLLGPKSVKAQEAVPTRKTPLLIRIFSKRA